MPLFDWIRSDLHSLNLDWIISKIKTVEESEQGAVDAAADANASKSAAAASATAANNSKNAAAGSATLAAVSAQQAQNLVDQLDTTIAQDVTDWLDEHITPTTPAVDDTLTVSGAAADAAVTGDKITELKTALNNDITFDSSDWVLGTLNPGTGMESTSTNRVRSPYISANKGDVIDFDWPINGLIVYCFGENKDYISDSSWNDGNHFTVTNESVKYVRILLRKDGTSSAITSEELEDMVSKVTMYKVIPKAVYNIDETVEDVSYLMDMLNVSAPVFVSGYYINYQNGTINPVSGYSYAEADVEIFRGGHIKGRTGIVPNSTYGIAFYDAGGGYISGVNNPNTGNYEFNYDLLVPANASIVRITLRDASAALWTDISYPWDVVFENIKNSIENTNGEIDRNYSEVTKKIENARHAAGNPTLLTILHFSDLHHDLGGAMDRIMSDAEKYGNIDDIICTGDMVGNTGEQIESWWNPSVLTCIGNHDSATYDPNTGYNWTGINMYTRYMYYIQPFKSNWNVTNTDGTSYYYKDYATQKVRLIVMDGMLYNDNGQDATTQTAWLASLLNDAITNNLHALIAIHAPHDGAIAKDCSFSKYGQGTMPLLSDCNTPQVVIDTVATAITNGLHFIGYIVGHTHQDNIWDATGDGTQLMYCVTCSAVYNVNQWKNSDQYRNYNADAYNIVTIDTTNTLVKIVRGGGADIDDHMRTRKAICFNYSTGQKVGEVL